MKNWVSEYKKQYPQKGCECKHTGSNLKGIKKMCKYIPLTRDLKSFEGGRYRNEHSGVQNI